MSSRFSFYPFPAIRANASRNVFLERLFDSRDLETTPYYISNNNQMIDVLWVRDSGIRINIGVEEINILPTYEDVGYDSDNAFMMKNPNTQEEKEHFRKIVSHHCRYGGRLVGGIYLVILYIIYCLVIFYLLIYVYIF